MKIKVGSLVKFLLSEESGGLIPAELSADFTMLNVFFERTSFFLFLQSFNPA